MSLTWTTQPNRSARGWARRATASYRGALSKSDMFTGDSLGSVAPATDDCGRAPCTTESQKRLVLDGVPPNGYERHTLATSAWLGVIPPWSRDSIQDLRLRKPIRLLIPFCPPN